jgi:Zn-dependent protease
VNTQQGASETGNNLEPRAASPAVADPGVPGLASSSGGAVVAAPTADDALLADILTRGEKAEGSGASGSALLITALLFVGLGGFQWGWRSVVLTAAAIGIHELGHVLAMRVFGYKNVRMLFVPLFGGLATGEPRELDATKNALVALAGPACGLAVAAAAGVAALWAGAPAWLVQFAWVSLMLNVFNLLPFVPLDGGQFANDTLFSRWPVLELAFRLLAIVALGVLAWALGAWLLGALAGFMAITTPVVFRRACAIRDARRDPVWQTRPLDREAVAALRGIVATMFKGVAAEKYQAKLAQHAHGVWLEIRKRFPGPGRTIGLLGGYLVLLFVIVPLLGIFLVRALPRPTF